MSSTHNPAPNVIVTKQMQKEKQVEIPMSFDNVLHSCHIYSNCIYSIKTKFSYGPDCIAIIQIWL